MIRRFVDRYMPLREGEAGGAAGGGAAGDAGAAAAAAAAAKPWHDGTDAETIGFWQNKGYDLTSPAKLANELTKQYREAEKYIGAPPDQIIKMPKSDAKPEEWKVFHQRLGAPADAKEYDFSAVKMNGGALSADLDAAMRSAFAQAFVPKEKALGVAAAIAKAIESAETIKTTANAAKIAEEQTKLKANWKTEFDFNHLKAMEGARRLGLSKENPDDAAAIQALEKTIGYARVMDIFRKIGVATSEDTFVERGTDGGGGIPHTREGAKIRLAERMADPSWGKRVTAGEVDAVTEWRNLTTLVDGNAA